MRLKMANYEKDTETYGRIAIDYMIVACMVEYKILLSKQSELPTDQSKVPTDQSKVPTDHPKSQLTSPKSQLTSPKSQLTSPKSQLTSPKSQPTSPKSQPMTQLLLSLVSLSSSNFQLTTFTTKQL